MVQRYGLGRSGTNTGTVATSVTDDVTLGGHGGAEGLEPGCSFYVTGGSTGSAPDDEETRISSRPKLSTGVATLDPALTVALAASDTYIVLYKPFTFKAGTGPYSVISAVNRAMTEFTWEKRLVPITLVTDGDMLASGVGDWTATISTRAKVTATFPHGQRALAVTDTGATSGLVSSVNIGVEADETYYLEATGRGVDAADAGALRLYNVEGAAIISLDESVIDKLEPETLINPSITIPSGCEQVQVQLQSTNASDVTHWSNVIFRKNASRSFVLSDRPQQVQRIGNVYSFPSKDWSERSNLDAYIIPSKEVQLDAGLWQINLEQSVSGRSVWYEEYITPATLSTAAGTTNLDVDDVAAVAAELTLRPLRRERAWVGMWERAAQQAAIVRARYRPLQGVKQQRRVLVEPYA